MTQPKEELNEKQLQAVLNVDGPCLVLAGAGSGKTRVVTMRITHLIEAGISPSQILGLTFTNKAAREMQERVRKLTQHHVLISTFHSLGAYILRESIHHLGYNTDFTIYDEDDAHKLLKGCLAECHLQNQKGDIKKFKAMISHAKNNLTLPDTIDRSELKTAEELQFPNVYRLYQSKLKEYNAADFDDLLLLVVELFKGHPSALQMYQDRWQYVLIDEYQDTNHAQYILVKLLVAKHHNICVVGDPDQSIYSWRGANIGNILNFEKDFPGAKTITLDQNYRSKETILAAANALIMHNDQRYEKSLWSALGQGDKVKLFTADTDRDEAHFVINALNFHHQEHKIPLKEIAIFYRTNSQSRIFEDTLLIHRIPYVIVGGISFYQRKEIKDLLAFLRIVHSGADFVSFLRVINTPKRGIGHVTLDKIASGAAAHEMTILDFCHTLTTGNTRLRLTATQKEGLKNFVSTIHQLRKIQEVSSLKELVIKTVELTHYLGVLAQDQESYDDRKQNIDELITKAAEWELATPAPTLGAFLEELSLRSSLDEADSTEDRVNLMTIHNGKGLEFKAVFLVGLEEDLFPHVNAKKNEAAIEEERRLCYVGMTRAKEFLYLTHCRMRYLWGTERMQRRSRFIKEIPFDTIEEVRLSHRGARPDPSTYEPVESLSDEFSEGDAVFHLTFGIGEVQEVFQSSSGLAYKVRFANDERDRTLVAKYAKLSKV